ncbi:MAG: homoserine dehydrogenase [Bacteroidetes bacterium]|nr:homoserine dehydrogenase [Bacteroidota bacterium]
MAEKRDIQIGMFGFGVVGQGLYDVLNSSKGIQANVVRICVKDRSKPRRLSMDHFTFDKNDILNNDSINLVVELIDNADEAFDIVKEAMQRGKHVVSANKKMVAEHFDELVALQHTHQVSFLYEGAACGSIPIIRTLEEYYDNELLNSIQGIFNGTTNYILSKIFSSGQDYHTALKQAQELGFAESNPYWDVHAFDAKFKLCIIAMHSFGLRVNEADIFNYGIPTILPHDVRLAKEKGYKPKLLATGLKIRDKLCLFVMPMLVRHDNLLFNVEDEHNAVLVEGVFSDKQFFQGRGAGSYPTGSAVLSDISATTYHYKYEYKKEGQNSQLQFTNDVLIEIYLRYGSEEVLKQFKFVDIIERHQERHTGFNYVVGVINLKDLMAIPRLRELDAFFALTPECKVNLAN